MVTIKTMVMQATNESFISLHRAAWTWICVVIAARPFKLSILTGSYGVTAHALLPAGLGCLATRIFCDDPPRLAVARRAPPALRSVGL